MQQPIRAPEEPKRPGPRRALLRLFPRKAVGAVQPPPSGGTPPAQTELEKEYQLLKSQVAQYQREENEFETGRPFLAGDRRIAAIVPPMPATPLRRTVGSPSMAGYLVSADCWQIVLSRFLKDQSRLLDIGCGCGKMARTFIYHPYVKKYIGFDVFRPSIDWAQETIVPVTGPRFEFHWIDVVSVYNPSGKSRPTDVVFPAEDGAIDLAFACSLFTHLFEEDAQHYLREVRRVLAPDGLFLPTIHIEPAPGTRYSGDEVRTDIEPDYFVEMAHRAGLRLLEGLGTLNGQEAFLFTAG
jgi:SAM-dependent methyltransferase